ncbi:MAG: AMP-binding protein [Gammaproteobacteria bacterium]|nr:AMP-binding protein [Gammaproteobacteria bacterium]
MTTLDTWLARHDAAASALRCGDVHYTYGELDALAARYAAVLQYGAALEPGARIAYLGANSSEEIALLFACARTGYVLVPLNWRLAAEELAAILEDCGAALLVVEASCAALAAELPATLDRLGICTPTAAMPLLADRAAAVRAPAPHRAGSGDTVLIAYTSGTTGRPKGAVFTHRALHCNALNSHDMHGMTAADRVLTVLPLFHVGGLNIQTLPALLCGAEVTLLPRFEPGATLATIAAFRPTLTVQVPATLQALLEHPAFETTDFSCLRAITTGSTDVPRELIRAFHARGVPVIQVYGATETAPIAVYQKPEEAYATEGSIGRAGLHTEIRLVRSDGTDCARDEPGEVWIRGGHLASGYWNGVDPESFAGGWFHSDDVARRDADGLYWFHDRMKNVIISGGENIYPAELERVLNALPGLREAAVVGRPDAHWGAVPVAVVVPEAEAPSTAALLAAFDGHVARYKIPKDVLVVEALPRNAMGKVNVAALKRMVVKDEP